MKTISKGIITTVAGAFALLGPAMVTQADEGLPKTVMITPGRLLLSEDFARPVASILAGRAAPRKGNWRVFSGQWDFADGALRGRQLPEDGRSAFVVYSMPFTSGVIQFDLRLDGCRQVIFRIQDAIPEHICSVRINSDGFSAQKDDHDHQGPDQAVPFGQVALPIAAGEWKQLLVEINGNTMTATMDGRTIRGSDSLLVAEKATVELVVTGQTASFRNLRVWEAASAR